jgi:hypothetical protein
MPKTAGTLLYCQADFGHRMNRLPDLADRCGVIGAARLLTAMAREVTIAVIERNRDFYQ